MSTEGPVAGRLSLHAPQAGRMSAESPRSETLNGDVATIPSAATLPGWTARARVFKPSGHDYATMVAPAMRLLWQNTSTGDRSIWLMSGAAWDGSSYALLPSVATAWSIAASSDFNADNNSDIVWQNTITGDRSIWFMTNTTWEGSYALLPNVALAWSIAGAGDFNNDGKPDLVWQNTTTGDRSIWFMNGSTWGGTFALLPNVAPDWRIAAVADFNADDKPDLVWQNITTGQRSIWFMSGPTWSGTYALLPTVATAWSIVGAADFDGDSKPDLVWQNLSTGQRSIWIMNGSSWEGSYALLPTVATAWSIAGTFAPPVTPALTVTLGFYSLMAGQTTEAVAVLRDADGNIVPNPAITWSSSDTAIAKVATNGFVSTFWGGTVTISAMSDGKTASAQLSVQAVPPAVDLPVIEFSPATYSTTNGKGLVIILDGKSTTTAATLNLPDATTISFRRLHTSSRFVAQLSHAQAASTCFTPSPGYLAECGFVTVLITNTTGSSTTPFLTLPRESAVSPAAVTELAADIQRTEYVVNIRNDGLRQTGNTTGVAQKFYQYFGDIFDYVALCEIPTTAGSIFYSSVRNRVTGLGISIFDNSAAYGASPTGKLSGFLNFRNEFDLGQQVTSHEMAHAFSNFLAGTALSAGIPHWPLSTTAFAIMGGNGNPGSNAGDRTLVPLGGGSYRVDAQSPYGGFNNLELYQMGLADSSEVEPQVVFQDQSQSTTVGSVLTAPETTVTIHDIAVANGLRTPGYGGIPVTFRLASVVVSRGRLLTASEITTFDLLARRGEATTRFNDAYAAPFYVNTKGRGILVTKLP